MSAPMDHDMMESAVVTANRAATAANLNDNNAAIASSVNAEDSPWPETDQRDAWRRQEIINRLLELDLNEKSRIE